MRIVDDEGARRRKTRFVSPCNIVEKEIICSIMIKQFIKLDPKWMIVWKQVCCSLVEVWKQLTVMK